MSAAVTKTVKKTTKTAPKEAPTVAVAKTSSTEFAVIATGGKQYVVSPGTVVKIEKISDEHKEGDTITFDKILMVVSEPLSTIRILSKVMVSPSLCSSEIFSILTTVPGDTTYCLPPVAITANSVLEVLATATVGASFGAVFVVFFTVFVTAADINMQKVYFT